MSDKSELTPEAIEVIEHALASNDWTNPQVQEAFDARLEKKRLMLMTERTRDAKRRAKKKLLKENQQRPAEPAKSIQPNEGS
jgi:hypothetical protein